MKFFLKKANQNYISSNNNAKVVNSLYVYIHQNRSVRINKRHAYTKLFPRSFI